MQIDYLGDVDKKKVKRKIRRLARKLRRMARKHEIRIMDIDYEHPGVPEK